MVPGMNQLLIRLPGLDGLAPIQPVASHLLQTSFTAFGNMSSGISLKFFVSLLIQESSLSQEKDS